MDEVYIYNRALSLEEAQQLYQLQQNVVEDEIPTDGLVAYWSMDSTTVQSNVVEAVLGDGNDHTGTLINFPSSPSLVPGKRGEALVFDGVDDRIEVAKNFNSDAGMSIALWARPDNFPASGFDSLIHQADGTSGLEHFMLTLYGSQARWFIQSAADQYSEWESGVEVDPSVQDGWVHLVATYDNNTVTLIVNGMPTVLDQVPGPVGIDNNPITFGAAFDNGGVTEFFKGAMDEIYIYNRALSLEEAQQLYQLQQADSDGDGIPDSWELQYGMNPLDASDASSDVDGDSLSALQEYHANTDPTNEDTDGDGSNDGVDPYPTDDSRGGLPSPAEINVYVAPNGVDHAACGSEASPCQSLKHAVTLAGRDEVIGLKDGDYLELAPIQVPQGVSITGVSERAADVVIRPQTNAVEYLIEFVDSQLNQNGDQSLSYVTLDGHTVDSEQMGWRAILVQNRNNVHIHHNRIVNFDRTNSGGSRALTVLSTEETAQDKLYNELEAAAPDEDWVKSDLWFVFLPKEPGPPGDYSNWVNWPEFPVKNFQFNHNYVYRSGHKTIEDAKTPGTVISTHNLKDSQFHHNEIDSRGLLSQSITGIRGLHDNVDVHDNIFRVSNFMAEGWLSSRPDAFAVETWLHIRGNEWYDNISNSGFSITFNKDSAIRDNIFIRGKSTSKIPAIHSLGIETGIASYTDVHHNYVYGGYGIGVLASLTRNNFGPTVVNGEATSREVIVSSEHARIFENVIIGTENLGISVQTRACHESTLDNSAEARDLMVYHSLVDASRWRGINLRKTCENSGEYVRGKVFNNLTTNVDTGIKLEYDAVNTDLTLDSNMDSDNPGFISGQDIIIVNQDDLNNVSTGVWNATGTQDIRDYGEDSVVHQGGTGDYFEFRVSELSTDGESFVGIWWPRNPSANRSTAVPVTIYDGDEAIASPTINQRDWDSSGWYYLGKYTFSSGSSRVRVHSVDNAEVVADAILISKLGQSYKLMSTSDAVDGGNSATTEVVQQDFFGNPVPQGSAPDIGVHEAR